MTIVPRTILRALLLAISIFCSTVFLLAFPHRRERCPAQGKDPRIFACVVCPLEQAFSFHAEREPAHLVTTPRSALSVFPPYAVTNWQWHGHWMMCRIGWRYDRDWRGYIGPTFAYKPVANPLLYY